VKSESGKPLWSTRALQILQEGPFLGLPSRKMCDFCHEMIASVANNTNSTSTSSAMADTELANSTQATSSSGRPKRHPKPTQKALDAEGSNDDWFLIDK